MTQFNKYKFKEMVESANFNFDAPMLVLGFDATDDGATVLRNRNKKDTLDLIEQVKKTIEAKDD